MQTRADGGAVMDEAPVPDAGRPRRDRDQHTAAPRRTSRAQGSAAPSGSRESASTPAQDDAGAPGPQSPPPHQRPDRWRWRRRIRAHPQQHFAYRVVIGILGLLCIVAGVVTGPLPGPGGIPLVLLGLAIWASEFSWAHRLLQWFKRKVRQVRRLPRGQKALFWVCFFAACGVLGYLSLLTVGVPPWLPNGVDSVLAQLPGVRMQ